VPENGARPQRPPAWRFSRGLLCACLLVVTAVLAAIGSAAASTAIDIRGTYKFDVCPGQASGKCTVNNFPQTSTITKEDFTSGAVTGVGSGGGDRWTVRGTVRGSRVVLTFTYTNISYESTLRATISADGNTISGTYTVRGSSSTGVSTATRISGAPTGSPPVLGRSADLAPVSGTVLIRPAGRSTFVPLSGAINVPLGSTIDTRSGTVSLTVALPNGGSQTGQFHAGEFVPTQSANGRVIATLAGGSFAGCPSKVAAKGAARLAAPRTKATTVIRQLWGNAHGNYTTKGRYASVSVSGTIWLTQDRCNGTYVRVTRDSVTVVAFANPAKRHTIVQGQHFLVPATKH
jgi:hypothetical protein